MKRWIALLLALMSIVALSACGESAPPEPTEAEKVEAQIGALGVIGLNSKDDIEAAETAWAALSPAEQAEVHNYAVLQAARLVYDDAAAKQAAADAEAAYAAAIAPFVGTWVTECPVLDPEPFELRDDGSYHKDAYTGAWSADPDAGTLDIDGTRWIVFQEDGFTKIRKDLEYNGTNSTYILTGDRDAAAAIKYVVVDFSKESILDYVGQPIRAGNWLQFGKPGGAAYECPSLVFDQGLVYYTCSADFQYQTQYGSSWGAPMETGVDTLTGNAQGRFCYLRAEYVADYRFEQIDGFDYRILALTNGSRIKGDWGSSPVDYDRMDYRY